MPRTKEIIWGLVKLGFAITFLPLQDSDFDPAEMRHLPRDVNILTARDQPLEAVLDQRGPPFSRLFVSRPHNMAVLMEILQRRPKLLGGAEVIYDAEALFARREMLKAEVTGLPSAIDPNELLQTELAFARAADRVTTVSRLEEREFRKAGIPDVEVLGYPVDLAPTQRPFKARQDFLFVGRMEEEDSPNVDSVVWFVNEVLPLIDRLTKSTPRVVLVGRTKATRVKALQSPRVIIVGEMEDIRPWYENCRVFIAPTRFAAGLPLKVCDAAAVGIPVVGTDLIFTELGWQRSPVLRSGTSAAGFARSCVEVYDDQAVWHDLRATQLDLVNKSFSRSIFEAQLKRIFEV